MAQDRDLAQFGEQWTGLLVDLFLERRQEIRA
jgi:hypothetical protein